MFKLSVRTDNEAFADGAMGAYEVARILRLVADALEHGTAGAPLHDINGNQVGRFDLSSALDARLERRIAAGHQ